MTSDQRRGMVADIGRRLALCSSPELHALDQQLMRIERMRDDAEPASWANEWASDDQHVTRRRGDNT